MIFGFNTDVRHGETLYHVQSEARGGVHVLETQVFVRGQCIAKRTQSYADQVDRPDFSEAEMQEMLKGQHKLVVDTIRQGRVSELVESSGS